MFQNLKKAMDWAKKQHPESSFKVKEQEDGPTIVSVKGKDKAIRTVIYVTKEKL